MRHDFVFVNILTKENKEIYVPAIILDDYEDKSLVAIFKSHTNGKRYSNFRLSKKKHRDLKFTLTFNGNIKLIDKNKVNHTTLDVSLNDDEILKFIDRLGLIDINDMSNEDYEAFIKFVSKYNKNIVKKGAVIPVIKDKTTLLHTYYIEEILEDGIVCIPISYDAKTGLQIKSFEREYVPYEIYITGVYYGELQETNIKKMLGDNSLKLK